MNKITIMALMILALVLASMNNIAQADGIGYINYKKIQENYEFAKTAAKEVDAKALELQQYLVDKEKEFKALDTPVKKKNFEDKTAKEFKIKQDAYLKMKTEKEDAVYNKIQNAAKQVLIEQKLDAIVDFRIIFVGGFDITDLVISKLRGK
ncbi:MAG: OmpH family outer membrane protein [Candidatus Gastranaerophilales bacterium]|nr:OmpH family outer membrane protein [Candidatus Gastranaerophilales bacterium]